MERYYYTLLFIIVGFTACKSSGKETTSTESYSDVQVVSAMKDAMWKGELYSKIDLDTISNKKGLYGLGPVSNLTGEIMLYDGKTYVSKVTSDSTMTVQETKNVGAPFFVYANINSWREVEVPDSIIDITTLEIFVDEQTKNTKRPFAFKVIGIINDATIHAQNLPPNSKVSSPQEAHVGQTNYDLKNEEVTILGFFSTEHKTVFTHHDSFMHLHLMTKDKTKMGHLDHVNFSKIILHLPVN